MRGLFIAFIRFYLRLKPWETSGRLYEWIGIRWVDGLLSRVFGEMPLDRYEPGDTLSREYLLNKMLRGQYSEVVNAMCFCIYVGLAVVCWIPGHLGLTIFALLIAGHHFLIVPIERYKRALAQEWLRHPEALTDEPADVELPYLRTAKELQHPYFRPLKFESEKFYDRIGVHSYRVFVFWLTDLAKSIAEDGAEEFAPNSLRSTKIEQLDKFEKETRTSETVHLLGILEHLPFAIVFLSQVYWVGIVYLLGIAYLNVYAIFLQRQHRVRLFKLLLRRANKATP